MGPLTKILQVGATYSSGPGHANLGPVVLTALAADPEFSVTVLTRTSSKGTLPPGVNVQIKRIDDEYSENNLVEAFQGFDVVVLTTGYSTIAIENRFVDAAAAAGVKRVILPHWGAPAVNANVAAASQLFGAKANVIGHAKTKESSGLTWTAVACGIFFDMVLSPMVGFDLNNKTASVWDGGDMTWSTSTKNQAARATVNILKKPEAATNRTIYVSSLETSHNALVAELERKTGQTWTRVNTTSSQVVREAKEAAETGNMLAALRLALLPYFAEGYDADYTERGLSDNGKLGLEQEQLTDAIDEVLKSQVPH